MINKVGRPKGVNQITKTIKIDKELIEFWNSLENKNRSVNIALKNYKEQLNK